MGLEAAEVAKHGINTGASRTTDQWKAGVPLKCMYNYCSAVIKVEVPDPKVLSPLIYGKEPVLHK